MTLTRIAARVQRLLERRGLDPGDVDLFQADPVVEESPALAGISSASIQGRIALGPRAGARVWRVGNDPDAPWVLYQGVLAPHAGWRARVVAYGTPSVDAPGANGSANGTDEPAAPVSRHSA